MRRRSKSTAIKRLLDSVPGKKTFGIYRFMPLFVLAGAALELAMINWHVGEINFYRTYKQRQAEKLAAEATADNI